MTEKLAPEFVPLVEAVEAHLLGKRHAVTLTLAAFFARGHLLLEDIPGVGKTTLAKTFAAVMGLGFGRVQFTSDLLPSDILGISYFDAKESRFILKKGPIFTPFLLADEINRAMPKTQSALLEAMEERHVTIDGVTYPLPEPFFVIATQNPHEEVGTFPLPLSQLDRFICSFGIGYPEREAEREVLLGAAERPLPATPLMDEEQIHTVFMSVRNVRLSDAMLDYLQAIVAHTRTSGAFCVGLSTRGALALASMTKAWARLHGRDYAIPDDLQAVAGEVCMHRLRFKEGPTTMERIRHELFSHVASDS
ncbi:AAA family ATPase [Hydrogenimonas urashimensis]|uniref:AAA family ATPase n=1 Tax=Hydrogenimonas urashimensis TaxID=2740515 RepID=UPI0019169D43|nr:AAA family ATPase [Hydrogenimonas urashimensis]